MGLGTPATAETGAQRVGPRGRQQRRTDADRQPVAAPLQHGMGARKMYLPFGPFLAFGALVALFAGDAVLDAYLGLF